MLSQDSPNVSGRPEIGDAFGATLTTGDFNGDGIDDLAVGVPGESIGQAQNAGAIHIFNGRARSILAGAREHALSQSSPEVSGVVEDGDLFGSTLTAGDFNGDGIDDLAVGVPGESIGQIEDAGVIHIFNGQAGTDLAGAREHALRQNSPDVPE